MLDVLSPNQIKLASWTLAVYFWFSCPYDGGGGPGNKTYLVNENFKIKQLDPICMNCLWVQNIVRTFKFKYVFKFGLISYHAVA